MLKDWMIIPLLFIIWTIIQLAIIKTCINELPQLFSMGYEIDFDKLKALSAILQTYTETHFWTLYFFVTTCFVYLQTWCIPGTFFMNLLCGSLFGTFVAWPTCILCNTLGATFAIILSKYCLKSLFKEGSWLGKKAEEVKKQTKIEVMIKESPFDLLVYLTIGRVFPGSPNWAMNLSFPHLGVPVIYMSLSIALGLAPWNYIACDAGSELSKYESKADIMNWGVYCKLIGLVVLCVGLKEVKNRLEKKLEMKKVE